MALAVLVLGAESSGNRLICRVLTSSGFADVSECRHENEVALPAGGQDVAWCRSIPYSREWPDVFQMNEILKASGYHVVAIVPVRDWWATAHSQVNRGHVRDLAEAVIHLRHSTAIFGQLASAGIPFVTISYESAVVELRGTISRALLLLGIDREVIGTETTFDGNAKWR